MTATSFTKTSTTARARIGAGVSAVAIALALTATAASADTTQTRYGYEAVNGINTFYREAGDPSSPAIVLLHGFPSSSHQYRNLIRDLGETYYVIAPDYPGFGSSDVPSPDSFNYTFDALADHIDTFIEQRGLMEYALVMHDYGAPVGFRIAVEHPERVSALLVQNGNAYTEGLSPIVSESLQTLGLNRSPEVEAQTVASLFTVGALQWQYTHGTRNPEGILPDNWLMDFERVERDGMATIQLDLLADYPSNVAQYPVWQAYMREHQPPVLVTWGQNDAFFLPAGAEAYARDVTDIELHLLDTGHFPLEEDGAFIAAEIIDFLGERGIE